ncbi:hypothetical protein C3492_06050 [Streptomyces sp. Ru62]|nr:hypothetical protein C3492_06050 [Streptomyces sp. Ru62]
MAPGHTVSASGAWRGCGRTGVMAGAGTAWDDHDRACAVAAVPAPRRVDRLNPNTRAAGG